MEPEVSHNYVRLELSVCGSEKNREVRHVAKRVASGADSTQK